MRIRDLAEETHTSTASILRFCHKFECNGFSEFKVKLQLYYDSINQAQIADVDETQHIHFLERVNEPFLDDKIEQAVALLADKGLVLFLGSGSSEPIAAYGPFISQIYRKLHSELKILLTIQLNGFLMTY